MHISSKTTEQESNYHHIEKMTTSQLVQAINKEDQTVALSVEKKLNDISALINAVYEKMRVGGRLFYIGAGTSGRLGILDASECPPTFGVDPHTVIGLIAGGDTAIRQSVEFAEDNTSQAWKDLQKFDISKQDFVIGITASGTTPYVIGGIDACNKNKIETACIVCNTHSPLARISTHAIEVPIGPEFITGSTRMKAGTAQKLILNMVSTSLMAKLGKIKDNKMVDMQLSNEKLLDRGTHIIIEKTGLSYAKAKEALLQHKSVRNVLSIYS